MVAVKTFTVTATCGRGPVWVLECEEAGAVSQVKRLERADEEMREAIAFQPGRDTEEFDIVMVPQLASDLSSAVEEAVAARAEAEVAARHAAETARRAVRELRARGLSVRDLGTLMGVSYQRAAQLAVH